VYFRSGFQYVEARSESLRRGFTAFTLAGQTEAANSGPTVFMTHRVRLQLNRPRRQ